MNWWTGLYSHLYTCLYMLLCIVQANFLFKSSLGDIHDMLLLDDCCSKINSHFHRCNSFWQYLVSQSRKISRNFNHKISIVKLLFNRIPNLVGNIRKWEVVESLPALIFLRLLRISVLRDTVIKIWIFVKIIQVSKTTFCIRVVLKKGNSRIQIFCKNQTVLSCRNYWTLFCQLEMLGP